MIDSAGKSQMYDHEIRAALKHDLAKEHRDAAIFDELPLCRQGRADVAAVNAVMRGYEIKSDRDSMNRLPSQIGLYDAIFDFSVAVTAERHLKYVSAIVPSHWGITLAGPNRESVHFQTVREPQKNPNVSIVDVIRLIWKNEAIRILRQNGYSVRPKTSVRTIWELLAKLAPETLFTAVRETLKSRLPEVARQRASCGD